MKDLFTPNFESDADAVAPKLAKLSGSSVAIYHWLHSRAFACGNKIGVSERWLAGHRIAYGATRGRWPRKSRSYQSRGHKGRQRIQPLSPDDLVG